MKTDYIVIKLILALALVSAVPCVAQTRQDGEKAGKMLNYIAESVISGKANKPMFRKVVEPSEQSGKLAFNKQSDLTNEMVERYLSRAVSHFLPYKKAERSNEFFRYAGVKYVHWSNLFWGGLPSQDEFDGMAREVDVVHGSEWGKDVVFEAGVMEIINRDTADATPIPDWLYRCMEDLGITKDRKLGPKGPRFFCYENMFDRNASNWPKGFVGMWGKTADDDAATAVPDITMAETQLWYAYQLAQFIDSGYESIMFGQIGLVGRRDKGWKCAHAITEYAKKFASARAYRHAVFLTSHHWQVDHKGKPIFTHLTWPSRLFYSDKYKHGMESGLYATEDGQHRTAFEFQRLLNTPHDLPILIEIDNYGTEKPGSAYASSPEGDDEITAFNKKPESARAAFLRQYYFEYRTYRNKLGKCRVHLAPSGERCGYMPYQEDGGDEETIKRLFERSSRR